MGRMFCSGSVALAAFLVSLGAASGQELRIGLSAEPSSMDPHYHYFVPNRALHANIYEALTQMNEKQEVQPLLATSWKAVDANTWQFKLRSDVKFSNGAAFTPRDVIFTLCRVPNVANSPGSFTISTRSISAIEAIDAETLTIHTEGPDPLLPIELSTIAIISADVNDAPKSITFDKQGCGLTAWPKTEDFDSGKIAIGTGPFRVKEFVKGDRIVLERNDAYRGEKPYWSRVTLRPITSAGPRVAALLAGDVDFIESPPVQDLQRIRSAPNLAVAEAPSGLLIYLGINTAKEPAPGIDGTDGKNPLKDKRVRQALKAAIDRDAIVTRIIGGLGVAAAELLPTGMFGTNPDAKVEKADPQHARKLLAEAGFPNGFKLLLGSPAERYPNDTAVAQAVAQLFSRIGVQTELETLPAAQYFPKANRGGYSVWLTGWLADTGEVSSPLRSYVASPNKEKGFGAFNGGYSNAEVDRILPEAVGTIDDAKRRELLQRATATTIEDVGVIPLYFQAATWALRKDLTFKGRSDARTVINDIKPAVSR